MTEKHYYTIGEVSEICDIPVKTLRYYDKIKLIVPEHRNQESNYRYYTKAQMITIFIMKNLKRIGFSLKEIKDIISNNETKIIEKNIKMKLVQMQMEIEEMNQRYIEGKNFLKRLQKGIDILVQHDSSISSSCCDKVNSIEVEEIPEINLIYNIKLMKNYKNYEVSLDRWIETLSQANRKKLKISGSVFVTYHDENILDKFLSKDCNVEFAVQVEEFMEDDNFRKFGGFKAATAIHVGKYEDILNTYVKIIRWINQNNYKITGYATEEFIISPIDVENENEHITKIIVPIENEDLNIKKVKNAKGIS